MWFGSHSRHSFLWRDRLQLVLKWHSCQTVLKRMLVVLYEAEARMWNDVANVFTYLEKGKHALSGFPLLCVNNNACDNIVTHYLSHKQEYYAMKADSAHYFLLATKAKLACQRVLCLLNYTVRRIWIYCRYHIILVPTCFVTWSLENCTKCLLCIIQRLSWIVRAERLHTASRSQRSML